MSRLDDLFDRARAGFRGIAESTDPDFGRGHAEHHMQNTIPPLKKEIQRLEEELDLLRRLEAEVLAAKDRNPGNPATYQTRVADWVTLAFGREVLLDKQERSHRFFEEACELVQASGLSLAWALKLLSHVYDRPAGEVHQEIGGVMTTFHSLAEAHGINAMQAGETELARINTPEALQKVRLKHASKPQHSPLPGTA